MALARYPLIANCLVRSLDRRPGDPVRGFFLTRVSGMGRERVIEGGTINVLRVRRQVTCDRIRQIFVGAIGHQWTSIRTLRFEGHRPLAPRFWHRDRADALLASLSLPDAGLHKDVPCAVPTFGINYRARTRTR